MFHLTYLDAFLGTVALYWNFFDMPTEKEWLTFAQWGEKYGKLSSVTVFGQPLIIVNSVSIAKDMLDKNSAIYSDRPLIPMGGELCGWKNALALLPYGDRFRNYRRFARQLFGNAITMKSFHPVEEAETHRFLKQLLSRPAEFSEHIRKTAGAIILRISHGYQVGEGTDPFVTLAERAMNQFALSTSNSAFLVNLVPFLGPRSLVPNNRKRMASTLNEMVDLPYNFVKQQIAAGSAEPSYVSKLLEGQTLSAEQEFEIKWSSASLYAGGADTTVSAIYSFFKALALYPEVQTRAQEEIDSVVGNDRLPSFEDRAYATDHRAMK
ncbi:cytochrome P450 [Gymnopus androsaceus JB14]|uniref:Cytochrome P450 n=1 Tax=Gymnopus androsaceus JB14 TaxID=1447944 RepID=A0A6A4H8K0_9AGAR|nr:cytochrome P450 [Gymnopus androsaceus JB14]